jgi:hypothetical protein
MRYIQSGSGRKSFLPKEILCLFLCGPRSLRISCVFLFTEPLPGWRTVDVGEQRTGVDWAHQVKHLLLRTQGTGIKLIGCQDKTTLLVQQRPALGQR